MEKTEHKPNNYGFVFNLDPHNKRGSHWVSMFLKLEDTGGGPFIGFFDSYGQPPPKEISQLIHRLKKQIKDCYGINLKYKCNTVQHQHGHTECGVYCLYFIYQCLRGVDLKQSLKTSSSTTMSIVFVTFSFVQRLIFMLRKIEIIQCHVSDKHPSYDRFFRFFRFSRQDARNRRSRLDG